MNKQLVVAIVIAVVGMFCLGVDADDSIWETDFEKASAVAKSSGKYMLLDFSGSDWCGWCIKLDREVFSQSAFKTFAEKNLVCVLVDFPQNKIQSAAVQKQNAELAKKYGIDGYPTVIILDPNGELAGATGYQEGGAENYVEHLKNIINQHKNKSEKGKSAK